MFQSFITISMVLFGSGYALQRRLFADAGSSVNALLPSLEPYLQNMFNNADMGGVDGQSSGDGMVSLDEVVANIDGVDGSHADHLLFDVVDADDDGLVSFPEFRQFVQYYLEQQMAGSDGTANVDPADIAQAIQNMIINN